MKIMLKIRDTKTTPREKRWTFPAIDGTEISSNSYMVLKMEIHKHYEGNHRPVPDEETIHRYLCDNLTIPCCEDGVQVQNRYTNPVPSRRPGVVGKDWPFALRPMKLLAKEGDRGLGDIVLRVIGEANSNAYKLWFQRLFGRPCGCSERQDNLNRDYPL